MRKLLALLAGIAFVFAGLLSPVAATGETKDGLSEYGQQGVLQLATCLRTASSLDVYYLIDNSTSLKQSDPQNQRTGIIKQDIKRWGDIAGQQSGLAIRIAGSFFNSKTSLISSWQQVTQDNSTAVGSSFTSSMNNQNLGDYTNWLAALQEAKNQLASSTATCKAVIWFTDGGLWMPGTNSNSRNSSLQAVAALCGGGSTSSLQGTPSASGIVAQMRTAGIHIFGILLHVGADTEANEAYYRSLMQPIIEESGQISGSGGLPGGSIVCGENLPEEQRDYAAGAFLEATSAADVAYSFMTIPSVVGGGSQQSMKCAGSAAGEFYADPGIDSVEISTDATSWVITDDKKAVIAKSGTGYAAAGSFTTGRVALPKLEKPAKWKFTPTGGRGQCQLFVYPEIQLEVNTKALIAGKQSSVTGQFVKSLSSGEKVDLTIYKRVDFKASVNKQDYPQANLNHKTGTFTIKNYTPTEKDVREAVKFGASLTLATEHYSLHPIEFEQEKQVFNASALPSIGEIKFEKGIESAKDAAVAKLTIEPPQDGGLASSICFDTPDVVADAQDESAGKATPRKKSWAWSTDGLDGNGCIDILMGLNEPQEVVFKVTNAKQANSSVTALFTYRISAGELKDIEDSQTATFETKTKTSAPLFWLWVLALMVGGLAIPFVILSILNHAGAKLNAPEREQFAIFAFAFDARDKRIVLFSNRVPASQLEHGRVDALTLGQELALDFKDSFREPGLRSYQLLGAGAVSVSAKASAWPLNGTIFRVSAGNPEVRLVSSARTNQVLKLDKLPNGRIDDLKYLHFSPNGVTGEKLSGQAVVYLQPSDDYGIDSYIDAMRVLVDNDALKESLAQAMDAAKAAGFGQASEPLFANLASDDGTSMDFDFDLSGSSSGFGGTATAAPNMQSPSGDDFDFKF